MITYHSWKQATAAYNTVFHHHISSRSIINQVHGARQLRVSRRAVPQGFEAGSVDIKQLSNLISMKPLNDEQKNKLEAIADVLQEPVATVKGMIYKRKAVADLEPAEVKEKIEQLATALQVTSDLARRMVVIQPKLLLDTAEQAKTVDVLIRTISYQLGAPREEVIDLIVNNPSVLHGREMHMGAADIARLAMLRTPRSRILD